MGLFGTKKNNNDISAYNQMPVGNKGTEKHLELQYKTRANTSLTDKKNVFLHYAKADKELAEKTIQRILDFENGLEYAIWSAADAETVLQNGNSDEIGQMSVFISFVTKNYLTMVSDAGIGINSRTNFDLAEINQTKTPVLPIFVEADTSKEFNRIFGDMHGLYVNDDPNLEKLEESLKNLLGDNELSEKIIKDAFSMKLFLSYRKKDRKRALEIMKKIHDTQEGSHAAIWFDDFLVPGDDFNHQILDTLEQADAMILSVTPNILEEGNYVKRTEYPEAKFRMGKNVIAIEADNTDRTQLSTDFPEIGDTISINDNIALNESIKTVESVYKNKEYTPYMYYLLGMAFLVGLRVEKDIDRAVSYLIYAAERNIYQACLQLAFLYLSGKGVKRDHSTAIKWNKLGYDYLMSDFANSRIEAQKSFGEEKEKNESRKMDAFDKVYDVLFGKDGLFLLLQSQGRVSEAVELGQEFADTIDIIKNDGECDYKWYLWQAECYLEMADLHFDTGITQDRVNQARDFLRKADGILNSYLGDEKIKANVLFAKYEYALGEICSLERSSGAIKHFERSVAILSGVIEHDNSEEYRKHLSGALGRLGLMQRDEGIEMSLRNPFNSIACMQPAKNTLSRAITLEKELVAERPTIHNREGLAIAYFNYALVEDKKDDRNNLLLKAMEIVEELQEETGDGSFNDFEMQLTKVMKKMHVKRKK